MAPAAGGDRKGHGKGSGSPRALSGNPPNAAQPGLAARLAAAQLLALVVDDHASLETLLDERGGIARWRALDQRDRTLARAIATTALRHRGRIGAAIDRLAERRPPQRARHLLHALHVGAAQVLFMDVPDAAAVDLAVAMIAGEPASARFAGFANAILRRMARERDALLALPAGPETVFPAWLGKRIVRDHGRDKAAAIAAMVGEEPVIDLTPHPRLGADATSRLAAELGAARLPTGTLRLIDPSPLRDLPGFREGHWWVQDAAASLPARMLGEIAGLRVADLCAAPGGKTAQLAAAGAQVTAVDVSPVRLSRLGDNLDRLRLEARIVCADLLDWRPDVPFDAILLDAPCSATGTMRRHPDIAWNRTAEDVGKLADLQRRMIGAAMAMLRPGGRLVYANCSLLKEEGEDLAAALSRQPEGPAIVPVQAAAIAADPAWINGQGALRTLPCHLPCQLPDQTRRAGGMDGFFAIRLRGAG